MASSQDDILIIGAGVAGLVLAQGLKYRGIPFKVFERDPSLRAKDQGYRFRCEGPGLDALEDTVSPEIWDLVEKTHPKDSPPVMTLLDPHTAAKQREMNTVADTSPRAQRCYPIDRPWFRELLYSGVEEDVVFGKSFEAYTMVQSGEEKRVQVTFADKSTATGKLVVAADGVRSRVRRQLLPQLKQVDVERMVLWARTPLNDDLRSSMPEQAFATHFTTAIDSRHPSRCVLWSAIEWPKDLPSLSSGRLSPQNDYVFWALSTEVRKALLAHDTTMGDKMAWIHNVTSEWDEGIQALFEAGDKDNFTFLPIYSICPVLPEWEPNPHLALLGDAIHAMSPTGGVGGRTAIEDARDLCMAIAAARDGDSQRWIEELRQYETGMRARAKVSVEQAFRGGKIVWAGKDWWEYESVRD